MPKFQAQEGGRSKAAKQARRHFDTMATLKAEGTPDARKQIKKLLEIPFHVAEAGVSGYWKPKAKKAKAVSRDYDAIPNDIRRKARI